MRGDEGIDNPNKGESTTHGRHVKLKNVKEKKMKQKRKKGRREKKRSRRTSGEIGNPVTATKKHPIGKTRSGKSRAGNRPISRDWPMGARPCISSPRPIRFPAGNAPSSEESRGFSSFFFFPFPVFSAVDPSRYIDVLYLKYTKDFKSDPGPIHAIVNKDCLRISIGDVIVDRPDHPITCRSLQNGPIVAESSNTSDRLNSHLVKCGNIKRRR